MIKIIPIPAFTDNYIWLLVNENNAEATVVDPGDADPVIDYLQSKSINLNSILLTHHHWDHSNGVPKLISHYPKLDVFASHQSSITSVTCHLKSGDLIKLDKTNIIFRIEEIPGHTLDHLSFFAEAKHLDQGVTDSMSRHILFTGDTLFMAGCGKVFEGTPQQMWESLQKIKNHPLDSEIYCGHEYTLSNLHFAQLVEPENADIQSRLLRVQRLRDQNKPTVPGALAEELKTNPFLRTDKPSVIQAASQYAKKSLNSGAEVFAVLREWKNNPTLAK